MSEFDVEVVTAKQPRKQGGLRERVLARFGPPLRALLMRPRALVFGGAGAFLLTIGTPHVGWDYECRYPMRSGRPCGSVSYCAYYGIQGRRVVFPEEGETCQVITFLPPDWQRLF